MATDPARQPELPVSLPGFTLLGVAGRGGMGVVYRAEQASPRRLVALKLLGGAAVTPESLAAFQREAQVIASLEHPYIVPLYGFGEHAGQPYLVMRYLRGGSAAARLTRGPVDLATAAGWVRAVAAALDFAHQRGLVHRDVKPSNILLDESGSAYLTDFGIAGALADPESGQGGALGSAAYMSPEQGRGEAVDRRADIYALAVTLFELLTGQKPYKAETALGVIVRHIHDPIPPARAIHPAVPPAVDALIQRGMAKSAAERPQTAGAFAQALADALDQPAPAVAATQLDVPVAPTVAAPLPAATVRAAAPRAPAAEPQARARRGPWLWLSLGLAALCLLGAAALVGGGVGLSALLGGEAASPTAPRATVTARPPTTAVATLPPWLAIDDFSDARSGFGTFADQDGGVAYVENVLRFTVLTEGIEWRSLSGRVEAANVRVGVTVAQRSGPARNELAVLCRYQDNDNYTALGLSADGHYAIWQKRLGRTTWLVDWTEVPDLALSLGTPQSLAATCAGDGLRLEAAGQALAEAGDPAPIAGDVGLLAGLRAPGALIVEFDDLVVTAVE